MGCGLGTRLVSKTGLAGFDSQAPRQMSKQLKDGQPPCTCPCHQGTAGFYHCFDVCCAHPDVVSDPAPPQRAPVKIGPFEKITFPVIKKVFPTLIASDIVAAAEKAKDDE